MSKFNVGDKVRIVDTIFNNQKKYKGEVHKISEINDVHNYVLSNMPPGDTVWKEEELELVKPNLYGELVFNYIDDTMDTSKRNVIESLYPNTIMDIKTCGKNLLDNFKIQNDFYHGIFNKKFFTNKIEEDASVEEMNNLYDMYVKGMWEIKEEKDMNKVLNLWCERKKNKIIDRYDEMECEFYNNKYSVVASFKELIEKFNNDLEDLYKLDKATEQFVLKENAPNNVIKYCLEEKLNDEFKKEYLSKRDEEFNELRDIKDEVEAQLSLSDDLEYQQEVLIRYGIIDKKTKKISE